MKTALLGLVKRGRMDLNTLNTVQRAAVETTQGAVLILAGAGSGKTRVLTHRIAYMLQQGLVKPWQILALTFTNKAAKEMRGRIEELIGGSAHEMWAGTFHSIFARILRREAEALGYERNFTIYDSDDQLKMIKQAMLSLKIDTNRLNPKRVRSDISSAKNAMLGPDDFGSMDSGFVHEQVTDLYREYQKRLKMANAMDFDDLLLKPIELFQTSPDRLAYWQGRFTHVMIDEYQDTNRAQFEVAGSLAKEHGNICVVGDDDQSIYGWRGADISNILDFESHWQGAKVFKLEQNYRSTETILEAAHSVVSLNGSRKEKKLWTRKGAGSKITLLVGEDDGMESAQVCQRILDHRDKGGFKDCAVLYRTNAQSRSIEDAFRRNGVRYQIVGGQRFYERREVKDVLAYLHLLVNHKDEVSLLRVINYPRRGIGGTSLKALQEWALMQNFALCDSLSLVSSVDGVSKSAKTRLLEFVRLMAELRGHLQSGQSATDVLQELIERVGLIEALEAEGAEGVPRLENVRELQNALEDYEENSDLGLDGFLQEVALVADVDNWDDQEDHVTMMTVHSAKGLEFPMVFVTGLEEGLFPLLNQDDPEALEEERRLFYVAATRAEDDLFLCYANRRRRYGRTEATIPSSFLDTIPEGLMELGSALSGRSFRGGRDSFSSRSTSQESTYRAKPAAAKHTSSAEDWLQSQGTSTPPPAQQPERSRTSSGRKPTYGSPQEARRPGKSSTEVLLNRHSPFRDRSQDVTPDYEGESQLPPVSDPADLGTGAVIAHHKYGRGVIIHTVGFGGEMRVSVRFDSVGVKKMVAKFAKLRLIR
jgi:DNA helicase II / ATP-dependent DNA helicase PcrA